ncbi:MAG TPA: thioredoxin domain-containing protein [Bacteroidota bacterium]
MSSQKRERSNRLNNEKSPYLLQHAFNPVDWYPWGEEAFAKARAEDKPIFLSIGYSTCYWCHVMEREVFENDSIAALMNRLVVSIKVDREERPDVDRIYMSALQAMTGSGGWPMSVFITPDLRPFFAATYIPPEPRYGRAGFPDILNRIHEIWTTRRQDAEEAGIQIEAYLRQLAAPENKGVDAGSLALDRGFESFSAGYDPQHAGFNRAPKFPRPVAFSFLLRYYKRTGTAKALEMTLETLKAMSAGGMYDHIGGGFHRYATDREWHVPHFEKMLYDQAQLVVSFLEAYQITRDPTFADTARDVLLYVEREMTSPEGGFYSAQDAESALDDSRPGEKKEGAFYTWTKDELDALLTPEEAAVFQPFYDIQESGNVRSDPHGEFEGLNILHRVISQEELCGRLKLPVSEAIRLLASARAKILATRPKRPLPHLDDKILVSWNGLMISALARAYQVLGDERYRSMAERACAFILGTMDDPQNGTLVRRYRDGEAKFEAHLEDYAFLAQGLLDCYEATLDARWLKKGMEFQERQNALLYDSVNGGFFDTTGSDAAVLVRTKESYDGAEPSGNSIALLNLLRLANLTGNARYAEMARASLFFFGSRMEQAPEALAQFLVALDFSLSKPRQIILAGNRDAPDTKALQKTIHSMFLPAKILLLADEPGREVLGTTLPVLNTVTTISGKAAAYVCENYSCRLPTADPDALAKLLDEESGRPYT